MSKKEKFNQKGKDNTVTIVAGIAIALIIAVAAFVALKGDDTNTVTNNGTPAATATQNDLVNEVEIKATVQEDKIVIKKSDVETNKIVKFDYEPVKLTLKSGLSVSFPLMAYVTPSGKIKVAVRMCEPCNGLTFSIAKGNILNCNTCGTQWDLETNQWNGVGSQSCGSYAPEILNDATINGDNIEIKIADFKDWLPRA
jgi:hypothetical protein